MRRVIVITLAGLSLIAPDSALASAGPVPPVQGGAGVSAVGSPFAFVANPTGSNTTVIRERRNGGTVAASGIVHGRYGVPGAAYDGSNTGLSADGRTLVLAEITANYPPTRTRLVVFDTAAMRVRARIALGGFFAVDAISPTGRWLYLVNFRSPATNPFDYEVRAFDLEHGKLLAAPVVDPRAPREKMHGVPITRTMSTDGRWAYTLYQKTAGPPFIHALDTATRRAYCVDLPALNGVDLSNVSLAGSSGTTLRVEQHGGTLALMDTRTFAVRSPSAARPPAVRHTAAVSRSDSSLLWVLGIAFAAVMLVFVLLARRRRQTPVARSPIADPR